MTTTDKKTDRTGAEVRQTIPNGTVAEHRSLLARALTFPRINPDDPNYALPFESNMTVFKDEFVQMVTEMMDASGLADWVLAVIDVDKKKAGRPSRVPMWALLIAMALSNSDRSNDQNLWMVLGGVS